MSEEERKSVRHRTLKGAKIVLNGSYSTFNCTVRNMSETGAKLAVSSVIGIPERFRLAMDDGRSFQCEATWRTETEIGVQFISE